MSLVMNALDEENRVTIGGSTFTFAPRQIKEIYNTDIADMITRYKSEFGFVGLPAELTYIVHLKDKDKVEPEHKQIIEDARKAGVEAYCKRLRALVYNAQVSLRKDLEKANFKHDVRTEWSDGDLKNLDQLVKYQSQKSDKEQLRLEKIKELEKSLTQKVS